MVKITLRVLVVLIIGWACYSQGHSKGFKTAYNQLEEQCVFYQSAVTPDGLVFSCQFQGVIQKQRYNPMRGGDLRTSYDVR